MDGVRRGSRKFDHICLAPFFREERLSDGSNLINAERQKTATSSTDSPPRSMAYVCFARPSFSGCTEPFLVQKSHILSRFEPFLTQKCTMVDPMGIHTAVESRLTITLNLVLVRSSKVIKIGNLTPATLNFPSSYSNAVYPMGSRV